jgi:hypothetical protein
VFENIIMKPAEVVLRIRAEGIRKIDKGGYILSRYIYACVEVSQ